MIEQKSQRLMAACTEGNLELVNRIASKFDSVQELCETEPSSGYTPLMMAARHGHLEVVEALIRLGHDRAETSRVRLLLELVCWARRIGQRQHKGCVGFVGCTRMCGAYVLHVSFCLFEHKRNMRRALTICASKQEARQMACITLLAIRRRMQTQTRTAMCYFQVRQWRINIGVLACAFNHAASHHVSGALVSEAPCDSF